MTAPRTSSTPVRTTLCAAAAVATLTLAFALPLPRQAGAQAAVVSPARTTVVDTLLIARTERGRVIVRTTEVGFTGYDHNPPTILIFANGPARVSIDGEEYQPISAADTVRLDRLPTMAFDVTDADVHVQLVTPGKIRLKTKVTGSTGATSLGATMRHIIFKKGGNAVTGPKDQ